MKLTRLLSTLLAACLSMFLLCTGSLAVSDSAKLETIQVLGILSGDGSGNLNLSSSVTRAQFVTMMVAASSHKDAVGSYGSSLFKDLKGDHWASPYVKVAVEQGWMSGYVDGTFRPDQGITAQLSKASALGLLDDVGAVQGQQLTRQDCVDLFYNALTAQNSAGTIYGTTLGYTVTNGQVDYSALVTADTKGPYVAESGALSLSFTPSSVYYNGALSSLSSVQQYDVYYYNANMKTVWIYHDRVTGTLTGVSPSKSAPTSATVAGVSYDIGTSEATYQLSSQGSFQEGDLVTLLLGMNGEIISVLDAQESEATYYGSVVSSVKGASSSSTSSSSTTSAQVTTQVACTDGVVRTFYHSGSALNTGRLVTVSVTQSGTKVTSLSNKKLEGSVSKDGSSFAGHDFADGVQILDTDENGGYARIYPSRLAGAKLSGDDVRYYSPDANGDIDRLVLHEVTGDTWEYVYVSSVVNNSSDMNISASYTYVQDGQTQTLNSSKLYSVKSGGAAMIYEDGQVSSMRQLSSETLDSVSSLSAMAGNQEYALAEDVQVLLRDGSKYYQTSLSQINGEGYRLTGWYDNLGCPAGERIRIIVATPR